MNTENITIKEGLKTLKTQSADNLELSLVKLFVYGVRFANDSFAIPALRELNRRSASNLIVDHLDALIGIGAVKAGSTFATTLASALCELDDTIDPFLISYGKALRDDNIFLGPREWLKANAEYYRSIYRPFRSVVTTNAPLWAKDILFPNGEDGNMSADSDNGPIVPEVVDDED